MIVHPDKDSALETAQILIDTKAILIAEDGPFTLTSGRQSPVYIDGKRLISFPKYRSKIIKSMVSMIRTRDIKYDAISGIESGSIAYGAWIAEALDAPMLYVRKTPKGFGRQAQVEGIFNEGNKILLIEDVTSDGKSKVEFSDVVRKAGGLCDDFFTIFFYNSFDYSEKILNDANINLHYLSSWAYILTALKNNSDFTAKTIDDIEFFLQCPDEWAQKTA